MSLDITPLTQKGRTVVRSYGDGGFTVGEGEFVEGSVILFPERFEPWHITEASEITVESLAPALEAVETIEMCIIGCGPRFVAPPKGLRETLRAKGMVLEWMDTGAACRTYGLMLMEERDVVAAMIAVE